MLGLVRFLPELLYVWQVTGAVYNEWT